MSVSLNLKDLSKQPSKLSRGHRLCAGCAESVIAKQVLMSTDKPIVVANATGCFEVSTTIFPYTAWEIPWIHTAFENAAATISGVESAYNVMKRRGQISEDIRFIAFAGDGGTYDIGFQALSGAIERGHQFMYVCLNNEAYMNTGIQRSSATSMGASTTTSPAGSKIPGKPGFPKDLTRIIAAHNIPYAAQASPHNWKDLMRKAGKGFDVDGPAFLNVCSPCPRGWRHDGSQSMQIAKMTVESCLWPLYEFENGTYRLTGESLSIAQGKKDKVPLTDLFKKEGRFKHLLADRWADKIEEAQAHVDERFQSLIKLCEMCETL